MKLFIDHADIQKIRQLYEYYPLDGVTTNPSILAAAGEEPYALLCRIRELIGKDSELHVQVISREAEQMVEEGLRITQLLGENTYVKVPAVKEGLKAIPLLRQAGCHVTATAIYTPMQAFLAAKAGAEYAAPYVNRIDDLGGDGVETVRTIQDMFTANGLQTRILAASFKNTRQVQALCDCGIGAATLSPDVMEKLLKNASVDAAVEKFRADFEDLCGPDATMLR